MADHTINMVVYDCKKCKKTKKCIFKVPKVLRRQNSEAYTPDVVAIGPFHYPQKRSKECNICDECKKHKGRKECEECKEGKEVKEEELKLMERVKKTYLDEILRGMNVNLEELMAKVIEHSDQKNEDTFVKSARDFYAEPLDHISSKDFMEMMIRDGCFLIQLFRKCKYEDLKQDDDPVFNMDCMLNFLCHDLLLLENQLPWFVLESLYNLILGNCQGHHSSLSILILDAFTKLPSLKRSCKSYKDHLLKDQLHRHNCHGDADVLHILDLIRSSIVVPMEIKDERANKVRKQDFFDPEVHQMHTATALSKAGIRFRKVERESIMDIRFEEGRVLTNGVFNGLNVGMLSESLFRNLIAIEQCYPGYSNEITSYAILMDNLISSKEDMELLCKAKVIGNWLSDEDGCKFFNNLYKNIPHNKFYYVDLCEKLNSGYRIRGYTWVASFKTEKFSNPWTVAAFFIGILLLALSLWTTTNNIRSFMQK
ncbi:UPF0481 protein At3g47200-like [Rosa rugosa]|uniref:UPF0481 protein At3g47200-like n=1 Tax=Rosa rugosa TaxID=74645 RepID=UPI002B416156|nr:UPF0481 protein At3g47200-like [Rosa rugosa]